MSEEAGPRPGSVRCDVCGHESYGADLHAPDCIAGYFRLLRMLDASREMAGSLAGTGPNPIFSVIN